MIAQIETHSLEETRVLGDKLNELGCVWSSSGLTFFESPAWNRSEHQFIHIGIYKEGALTRSAARVDLSMMLGKLRGTQYDFDGTVEEFMTFIEPLVADEEFEVADEKELTSLLEGVATA